MAETFCVCQCFANWSYEYVLRHVSADEVMTEFRNHASSVAGRHGTTRRAIITDGWRLHHGRMAIWQGDHIPAGHNTLRTPLVEAVLDRAMKEYPRRLNRRATKGTGSFCTTFACYNRPSYFRKSCYHHGHRVSVYSKPPAGGPAIFN